MRPSFFVVPAGSKPVRCNGAARGGSCSALIYWVVNPTTGNRVPVDCDVEGGMRPSETTDCDQIDLLSGAIADVHEGRGVSHFLTCPDADIFSRGNRQ